MLMCSKEYGTVALQLSFFPNPAGYRVGLEWNAFVGSERILFGSILSLSPFSLALYDSSPPLTEGHSNKK